MRLLRCWVTHPGGKDTHDECRWRCRLQMRRRRPRRSDGRWMVGENYILILSSASMQCCQLPNCTVEQSAIIQCWGIKSTESGRGELSAVKAQWIVLLPHFDATAWVSWLTELCYVLGFPTHSVH